MKVAFYAPLKPPGHPVPSGDRLIARLLVRALEHAGHEVTVASRLRSRDGTGSLARQRRIARLARRRAGRLISGWTDEPSTRPDCWLTYHLFHKAPDWIGPRVTRALGIPYFVVEASHAEKQRGGRWRHGLRAAQAAIEQAECAIALNRTDVPGLCSLGIGDRVTYLPPFIDSLALERRRAARDRRRRLARAMAVPADPPWLISVAMMRPGRKVESFECLASALESLRDIDWHCLLVGDGTGRETVARRFRTLVDEGRVSLLGRRSAGTLYGLLHAADAFVWPAIGEPLGMAMLEAQGAGLPVVAGCNRGVSDIVEDGVTGVLPGAGDAVAFASALRGLLAEPALMRGMGEAARARVRERHSLGAAAALLDRAIGDGR